MRPSSRSAFASLLFIVPALAPVSGCGSADLPEEDVESASSELLGPVSIASSCTPNEQAFLLDSAKRGRVIADSSAFETCIRSVMTGATQLPGDINLPRIASPTEGPYDFCAGDPAVFDPPGTVVALTRSNLGVAIGCKPTASGSESAEAIVTTNPGANETLTYIQTSLDSSIAASDQNYVAAAIWHEAMHQHGFVHGSGPAEDCGYGPGQFTDDDAAWMRRHTVPYIVSACMGYLGDISDTCRASLSCKPDEVAIRSGFSTSASCVCGHDPGWHLLPPFLVNQLAVAKDNVDELEIVSVAPPAGGLFTTAQTAPNGLFGSWSAIPGVGFVQVDVGQNQDRRLEAFAVSNTGTLFHTWQSSARVWGGLQSLGRNDVVQVAASSGVNGVLHAFVLTGVGSVFHTSQTGPNGGWTGVWESLGGGGVTAIRVGQNQDGRPEVFAIGGDKALYHQWQWGGTTTWSGWSSLGRHDVDQVALANENDGTLTAFVRAGGAIFSTSQSGPNGGWGGAWTSLGGTGLRDVSVGRGGDGHVRLFAVGGDSQAYMRAETSPMTFAPWALVQGSLLYYTLAVGVDQAGRTNLVGLETNGLVSQVAVP